MNNVATGETAELLRFGGKEGLLEARTDLVEAKGKGTLETQWLKTKTERSSRLDNQSMCDFTENCSTDDYSETCEDMIKVEKLVTWNCSMLLPHLKGIVAQRQLVKPKSARPRLLTVKAIVRSA